VDIQRKGGEKQSKLRIEEGANQGGTEEAPRGKEGMREELGKKESGREKIARGGGGGVKNCITEGKGVQRRHT